MANSEIGYAIGNGTSREFANLKDLIGTSPIVGCNWFFKDGIADTIVAIDQPVIDKINEIPQDKRGFRHIGVDGRRPGDNVLLDGQVIARFGDLLPGNAFFYNSGLIACAYLAGVLQVKRLYMFGFDFFKWEPGQKKNDIYSNTILRPVRNFEKKFTALAQAYPGTEFIRVGSIHPVYVRPMMAMMPWVKFMDFLQFEVLRETATV